MTPDHTATVTDQMRRLYRKGAYWCGVPPVPTNRWTEDGWCRFILATGGFHYSRDDEKGVTDNDISPESQ